MWNVIGLAVGGVVDWFKGDQELNKVKAEGKIEITKAKTKATVERLNKESQQDYDLNTLAVKNMAGSWKDEFVLVFVSIPFAMCFIPSLQDYAIQGFETVAGMPLWYQILLISIFFSIYGLRDILKLVLQLILKGKK